MCSYVFLCFLIRGTTQVRHKTLTFANILRLKTWKHWLKRGETFQILRNTSKTIQEAGIPDSTETDENGYYLFTDLAAGYYALTYEKEGYETKTEYVILAEGEDKGLAPVIMEYIEEGIITGYVEDAKGNPIESAKIKLKGITTKVLFTTDTDADGFFEFAYLDADTYIVIARKKGYKRSSKTVKLEEGEEKEIQIKMKKTRNTFSNVTP